MDLNLTNFMREKLNVMYRTALLSVFVSVFVACGTFRPEVISNHVVRTDAVFDDYVPMLAHAGYNMYSYDISGFCDTVWRIKVEGRAYNPEKGIYKVADKLTVGLYPGRDDSYQNLLVSVENQGSVHIKLPKLFLSFPRPIYGFEDGYYYGSRPTCLLS